MIGNLVNVNISLFLQLDHFGMWLILDENKTNTVTPFEFLADVDDFIRAFYSAIRGCMADRQRFARRIFRLKSQHVIR